MAEQVSEDHVYPKRGTSLRHHNLPWLNKYIFQYMKRRNNLRRQIDCQRLNSSTVVSEIKSYPSLSLTKEEYFRKLDPCNPKQFQRCYDQFCYRKVWNYSGFNRTSWRPRSIAKHRDVKTILKCTTKSEKQLKESVFGCRYFCLLELPYFDAIRKLIIDPMHNLYIGTTKSIMHNICIKARIQQN